MQVTEVKIRKLLNEPHLKAIVSITIDGSLAVHGIKVVHGHSKLFIAMPSKPDDYGIFRDTVHPIDTQTRAQIETAILTAYETAVSHQI